MSAGALTIDALPQPLDPGTRPGLARLTRVELRKMVDTRSGFWLQAAVVGLTLLTVVISLLTGDASDHTLRQVLSNAMQPALILLPIVGILLVTSEWSQRTGLITFALVPERSRVVAAKLLAGLVLAVVAFGICLAFAALGMAVAAPDVEGAWSLPLGLLGQNLFFLATGMVTGVAFGAALLSSAPAIVVYFALPTAFSALGAISFLKGIADWVDSSQSLTPLTEEVLSATQWAQATTTLLLWMVLPLAIGLWRIHRNEVR